MKDPYGYRPYRGSRVRRRGIVLNTLLVIAILAAALWVLCLLLPLEEGGLRFPGQKDPSAEASDTMDAAGETDPAPPSDDPADVSAAEPPAGDPPAVTLETPEEPGGTDEAFTGQLSLRKNVGKASPLFPPQPEAPQNNRMILLSAEAFTAQADLLLTLFENGAITGAAVILKDENGTLFYPSAIPEVQNRSEILRPVSGLAETAARLKEANLPLTAVLYTHCDDLFPRLDESIALQNINHIGWRDHLSRVFLDPANPAATAYLTAVAAEAEQLGFRELLLRGVGYPSAGRLTRIAYPEDRFAPVTAFVQAVQEAVSAAKVSVWLDSPGTAENQDTGQSVRALYETASRVFAELPSVENGGYTGLQNAVAASAGASGKLVAVVSDIAGADGVPAVLLDVPPDRLTVSP